LDRAIIARPPANAPLVVGESDRIAFELSPREPTQEYEIHIGDFPPLPKPHHGRRSVEWADDPHFDSARGRTPVTVLSREADGPDARWVTRSRFDVWVCPPLDRFAASTDDIACWFIDSDYNGESFFVRHAYFTGADEPYGKLKRALRAEIDEAAWSSLYRTVSRPFAKPESHKIAVKVINHYGDEVLKVFEV
jgi:hypothetical protein